MRFETRGEARTDTGWFAAWLRTGRQPARLEVKFNPWHDPKDGRFTFAGAGTYHPGGAAAGRFARSDPRHARNHGVHTVKPGETLGGIAASRNGLKGSDLAWLNDMPVDRPLKVGQAIRVPHQAYLDANRAAYDRYRALAFYMQTHGGRLPANVARPPDIEQQIDAMGQRTIVKNGYSFPVDAIGRTRRAYGFVTMNQYQKRSRVAQAQAGGIDRRPSDHGGHYIARQFNGPHELFNHFAQNGSFNKSDYRALEIKLEKAAKGGSRVFVDITPHYRNGSLRPWSLTVRYTIDGREKRRNFDNERNQR